MSISPVRSDSLCWEPSGHSSPVASTSLCTVSGASYIPLMFRISCEVKY